MNGTDRTDRLEPRTIALGVIGSVLLHALIMALLRFEVTTSAETTTAVALVDIDEPETEQVVKEMELVVINEVPTGEPTSEGGGSPASSSTAAPFTVSPTQIATQAEPLLTARPAEERAFEPLVFADPMIQPATLIDITDLPTAEDAPAQPSDEHPLYEPGGVGKAKKNWASAGNGEARAGNQSGFGFGIGVGGGHCPMPGQSPMTPPDWGGSGW